MRYWFDDFELDLDALVLRRGGAVLPLQPKVLDVLRYLVEHPGRLVSKAELLEQLWPGEQVGDAALSWSVSHIRRALGQERGGRGPIETVHRRGYRFVAELSSSATPRPPGQSVPPPARPSSAPPLGALIGRERVLAELQRELQQALAGRGSLSLLTGEPGIGKTRCADELLARAPELGVRALRARCPQEPDTPSLWPVLAALGQLEPELPELAARARALARETHAPPSAEGGELAPGSEAALFLDAERVAALLRELARAHPTLLVLDDLHWADAGTRRLLAFIAPELRELPLCVVGTQREAEDASAGPGSLQFQITRHARSLPLSALDREQVAELLTALTSVKPSPALAEAVRRASGGVPLFVEEVARTLLLEHGAKELGALAPEAVRVPPLARDLLRERIQRLPPHTVELMALAAVIGERFDLSLLAGLAELEPEALLDRLEPARAEGQVITEAPHLYRFAHALYQSVLYTDLAPAQRVQAHRKVGVLLEGRADREQRKGEIARHYHLSLPAGEHGEVVERARAAGHAAARASAFDDACAYYAWALEAQTFAGTAEPRDRAALLISLAAVQRSAGRTGESLETTVRALELSLSHQLHDLVVAAVRLRRPSVAMASVPDELSRAALETVLRHARDAPTRIGALSLRATLPPFDPDLSRSKQESAEALALAERLQERERLLEALRARLFALSGPSDIDALLAVADRVLAVAKEAGGSWQSGDARSARYMAYLLAGRIGDADAVLDEMKATIPGPHFREATFFVERLRAQRLFLDGHFAAAEQRWQSTYGAAMRAGMSYAELFDRTFKLGLAFERQGAAAMAPLLRIGAAQPGLAVPYRAGTARLAAQAGDLELVRSLLSTIGDPRELIRDASYLHVLASLSTANAALADLARCELLHELLAPYADFNTPDAMGFYLGSAAYYLGLTAAALGRDARAAACFEHALERNRAMGYRAGQVRTLLADAKLQQRLGRAEQARARLREAGELARELGMAGALADAERALTST